MLWIIQSQQGSRSLLTSCKSARTHYEQHLQAEQKKSTEAAKLRKRKALENEVKEVKEKQARLSITQQKLNKEATELACQAEKKKDFLLLSKSNALRQKAAEHSWEVKKLEQTQIELKKDLKEL